MNDKVTPDTFRDSMDRCFSDVGGDPFLARRIIAGGKEEPKMKKKLTFSLVCALVLLFALTALACAATGLFRRGELKYTDWNGNVWGSAELKERVPDPGPAADRNKINRLLEKYLNVPDGEVVYAFETENPGNAYGGYKLKQKHFDSWPEFRQFMEDHHALLTLPSRMPDNMVKFIGIARMECRAGGNYRLIDKGQDGPVTYERYTLDDADSVITEYELIISVPGREDINIRGCLSNDGPDDIPVPFYIPENGSAEKVSVSGMPQALLVTSPDPEERDALYMSRALDASVTVRKHPYYGTKENTSDTYTYSAELLKVYACGLDREEMIRFFAAE